MSTADTVSAENPKGGPAAQPATAPTDDGRSSAEEILYPNEAPKGEAAELKPAGEGADKPAGEAEARPAVTVDGFSLRPPEGLDIDPAMLAEAAPIFREVGLDNDGANKLMPLAGKLVERFAASQNDEFRVTKTGWAAQAKADPSIGGANWPETERLVAKALNAVGAGKGSELRDLLDQSGLGNHPAMIRAFRHFGTLVGARKGPAPKLTTEQVLYGNRS
jgi:hypothetical protein